MNRSSLIKPPLYRCSSQYQKLTYGLSIAALLTVPAQQAVAGGFQLSDHSISSLGRNHAGYGVVGDDAAGPNEDGTPGSAVVPLAYYVFPTDDKFVFGIGITSPFGTNTDYDNDFFGRFSGTETQLTTIDINPSLGVEVTDNISIGIGASLQTLSVTLDSRIPLGPASGDGGFEAEGDSVHFGINAGISANLPDNSRIGLGVRSGIEHDLDADAEFIIPGSNPLSAFAGEFGASATFESPATAYFGYYKPINENYFFTAGVRWTEWDVFEEIRIEFDDAGGTNPLTTNDAVTPINWSNSFTYAVGIDAVPDDTRSVRTIDSDRTAISFGGTYRPFSQLTLDFAYRFISFADADINQPISAAGNVVGATVAEVSPEVNTLSLQANYKF